MFGGNSRVQPASSRENPFNFHPSRLEDGYKVIQNSVCNVLIENPLVPERLEIILQGLEFDAFPAGNVGDYDCPEIRLTRFGTNGRELVRSMDYYIFSSRM